MGNQMQTRGTIFWKGIDRGHAIHLYTTLKLVIIADYSDAFAKFSSNFETMNCCMLSRVGSHKPRFERTTTKATSLLNSTESHCAISPGPSSGFSSGLLLLLPSISLTRAAALNSVQQRKALSAFPRGHLPQQECSRVQRVSFLIHAVWSRFWMLLLPCTPCTAAGRKMNLIRCMRFLSLSPTVIGPYVRPFVFSPRRGLSNGGNFRNCQIGTLIIIFCLSNYLPYESIHIYIQHYTHMQRFVNEFYIFIRQLFEFIHPSRVSE
jgi:hypothetical protein